VGLAVTVGLAVVDGFVVGVVVGEELSCGEVVGFDVGLFVGLAVGVEVTVGALESLGREKYATVPTETTTIIMQSMARIEFFIFIASLLR
jgi:hypothetical protein